jgi:hypothetical protein
MLFHGLLPSTIRFLTGKVRAITETVIVTAAIGESMNCRIFVG